MSYRHCIEELLGIQGISEIYTRRIEEKLEIYITHNRKKHKCPCCGNRTNRIHDYRIQTIKDLDAFGTPTRIILKKRRYVCENCGKRFYEEIPYLPKYQRMTQRMIIKILDELGETRSFSSVAREHDISTNTVIRIFDKISYDKPAELPVALSIDEFKGNTGGEKYNCIIADPINHRVIDILPRREQWYIQDYFLKYTVQQRARVGVFVSDMWNPYQQTGKELFGNAMKVIDKYHWSRQIVWAFERVRKDVQKHLLPEKRRYFKHSRNLLIRPFNTLENEDKMAVNVMLYYSADMSTAHFYKEKFQDIKLCKKRTDAKKLMDEWISSASECEVSHIANCAKTMNHWKRGILDSFTTSCTNGFIEGCNNKIKVLKRNAFGYRNFRRFRNRILYIFSSKKSS